MADLRVVVIIDEDLDGEVAFQQLITPKGTFQVFAGPEPTAEVHCGRCQSVMYARTYAGTPAETGSRGAGDPIPQALAAAAHRRALRHRCWGASWRSRLEGARLLRRR
jgi:hypothetical protein